mgnify:CR=1 FL=1
MELKRLLGGLDEGLERGGIGDSQLGDGLAVHLDASLLQAVHEAGIVHAVGLDSGCLLYTSDAADEL